MGPIRGSEVLMYYYLELLLNIIIYTQCLLHIKFCTLNQGATYLTSICDTKMKVTKVLQKHPRVKNLIFQVFHECSIKD